MSPAYNFAGYEVPEPQLIANLALHVEPRRKALGESGRNDPALFNRGSDEGERKKACDPQNVVLRPNWRYVHW
jgi:hypothetical protein